MSLLVQNGIKAQGPNAAEAAGFEPVDATDMVNLSSGDLSYVLPLMEIPSPEGGFPVNLSYHAGITSDINASWVGLGWYLNPGAINRNLNAIPDDWNGGKSINFISFSKSETFFSISADVGFPAGASVGVGLNWGGNRGLSGTVSGSFAFASAAISTTGNVTVGVGAGSAIGGQNSPLGVGGGISYSTQNQWSVSGGPRIVSEEWTSKGGYKNQAFVGVNFSSNGGFSINSGVNISGNGTTSGNTGGGTGLNTSSFSSGDYSINQQSTNIALPLHIIGIPLTLGFGRSKVTYKLRKGYNHREWGALYASNYFEATNAGTNPVGFANTEFSDYQNRTYSMDIYHQTLPQPEEEFVADQESENEKINFTFMGYDDFNVSAQGVTGSIKPRIFQNITLFGKGDNSQSDVDGRKIHTFYHHGTNNNANVATRQFGQGANDLYFYFDGQFTSSELVTPSNIINSTGSRIDFFLSGGGHASNYVNAHGRARTPSFIEVYTNSQIASGYARSQGLITPQNIPDIDRGNISKFDPDGIGGYKITAPDGKTYHFSLPVYHYEYVYRTLLNEKEQNDGNARHVNEKRQYSKYATHWLLTGITGPDYLDNGDNYLSEGDEGYWVELEYGKWSDGFVWRTPYEQGIQDYNTNIENEILDDDWGYYTFGRKQLYYLDKVKTRTHTAFFVKDIRYDAVGQNLQYRFDNYNDRTIFGNPDGNINTMSPTGANAGFNQTVPIDVLESQVNYAREYSLKLDKIVLVKNEDAATISKVKSNTTLGSYISGYTPDTNHQPLWRSVDFISVYGSNYSYGIHQEDNVIDINDIPQSFISEKALRVVQLNHSYTLAKSSPSSPPEIVNRNPNRGKLTLDQVLFLGKGGQQYMPPMKYGYYMEGLINISKSSIGQGLSDIEFRKQYNALRKEKLDDWGYLEGVYNGEDKIKAWSLKEITMPTGAKIQLDYEQDTYWTEAFGRRFWEDGLEAKFTLENGIKYIYFRQDPNVITNETINFTQYFDSNENIFLDTQYFRNPSCGSCGHRVADFAGSFEIVSLSNLLIKIKLPNDTNTTYRNGNTCGQYPWSYSRHYSGTSSTASVVDRFVNFRAPFGGDGCGWLSDGNKRFKYRLLANRVPEDETGGGLRVSRLTTISDEGTYITDYDYTYPQGHGLQGNTSGITSYAPVNGLKFIPYQSELPPPGVMYEYVTVSQKDVNNNTQAASRYRFNVLRPVFNIFDPEISMEAMDPNNTSEDNIFWASVQEVLDGNNTKKVAGKKIDLYVNTAMIGQLKSIEQLNGLGHVISKTENQYINGRNLVNKEGKGYVKESFNAMKTVFRTNDNGTTIYTNETKRLLSVSSRTEYNNMLGTVTNYSPVGEQTLVYTNIDPYLGSFTETRSELSDGTQLKTVKVPAYTNYTGMGAKTDNRLLANMLTQEAMNVTSVFTAGQWKTIDANVTTWKENWPDGAANKLPTDNIWRKHQTFVWKDVVDAEGTYGIELDPSYFDWSYGAVQTNSQWLKTTEITRYNRWSSPLEIMDVNNNYVATKMADNESKVLVTGNARYSEIYYSGAEYGAVKANTFPGGVLGANLRTREEAHTGQYSVKTTGLGQKAFEINGTVSDIVSGTGAGDFRPGTYKVSVWSKKVDFGDTGNTTLFLNGARYNASEKVTAGCWEQYNFYVPLQNNTTVNLYVTDEIVANRYFDDFTMHPVYASINSYVYDNATDELKYILDANNLATGFVYDAAGRLCKTYNEAIDQAGETGGFKLTNQYTYKYKDGAVAGCEETIDNCIPPNICDSAIQSIYLEVTNYNPDTFDLERHWANVYDNTSGTNVDISLSEYIIEWSYWNYNTSTWSPYEGGGTSFFVSEATNGFSGPSFECPLIRCRVTKITANCSIEKTEVDRCNTIF
ncbi:hypothetical protein [Leptobacterium sp. I13]|uniref:hypothetical protein n=1 Tax=Leptobacterium meishanense TaxID=3128904 RepID=UPI0030ED93A9